MLFILCCVLIFPHIVALSVWANRWGNSTVKKYQNQRMVSGFTGAEAVRRGLAANGVADVPIDRITGKLSDCYDPVANVIRLSENTYNGTSVTAVCSGCQQIGHLLQYRAGKLSAKARLVLLPYLRLAGWIALPMALIGGIMGWYSLAFKVIGYTGILLFLALVIVQLIVLPAELSTNNKILISLRANNLLYDSEMKAAKSVMRAATFASITVATQCITGTIDFFSGASHKQ